MTVIPGVRLRRPVSIRALGGVSALALALLLGVALTGSGPAAQVTRPTPPDAEQVARGEYLANRVAMCVQCHSSRDEHGVLIESQKFRGGAIPVKSPYRNQEWAYAAPNLAGLSGFTDDQVVTLLVEGWVPGRPAPKPPMPPFRLLRSDAEAVVAYLRSR